MGEHDAVLFANEAFYHAFAEGDVEAMEELWAQAVPVACIHPGWTPLSGRDQVMESWRAILGAGPPPIRYHDARAYVHGEVAFVICYEAIDQGLLAATNIFLRQGQAWKMVHHQAAPTATPEPDEDADLPGVVH